jgi:transposase InsO family protein
MWVIERSLAQARGYIPVEGTCEEGHVTETADTSAHGGIRCCARTHRYVLPYGRLQEMEVEINRDLLAIILLYSLPDSFENFRCAIESRDHLPTPDVLRVKIIEESNARKTAARGASQNALFSNHKANWRKKNVKKTEKTTNGENSKSGTKNDCGNFKYRCYKCKEIGHKAADCKNKDFRASAKSAEDTCLSVSECHLTSSNKRNTWCLDSGATSHLCNDEVIECEVCLQGKMVRTPFPKRSDRTSELLELIHSDVCGPMRVESRSKARYFIEFIDDCSRWTVVRFLRSKSEAIEATKEFITMVENQQGKKIRTFQTDNGGEYTSEQFDNLLKGLGITRRFTIPHNPEQNGIAERKNRTLLDMARCLMLQSGLPPSFWAEAVNTANYIRNRCPSKSLGGRTPYEVWTGKKPNVSHFREFGCHVFRLDRQPNRGKFDSRAKEGVFLGYSEESKGYGVWMPNERKVEITRDVKFLEAVITDRDGCPAIFPPVVPSLAASTFTFGALLWRYRKFKFKF